MWMVKDNHKTFFGGVKGAIDFFKSVGAFYTPIEFDWMKAILKEHSVIWSATYATSNGRNEFQIAIEQMGSGLVDLKPLVTHRFSLGEIQKGLETSFDKTSGAIKVQIQTD